MGLWLFCVPLVSREECLIPSVPSAAVAEATSAARTASGQEPLCLTPAPLPWHLWGQAEGGVEGCRWQTFRCPCVPSLTPSEPGWREV